MCNLSKVSLLVCCSSKSFLNCRVSFDRSLINRSLPLPEKLIDNVCKVLENFSITFCGRGKALKFLPNLASFVLCNTKYTSRIIHRDMAPWWRRRLIQQQVLHGYPLGNLQRSVKEVNEVLPTTKYLQSEISDPTLAWQWVDRISSHIPLRHRL